MNANVSAVRSVPGRSSGSNLCRRCDREVETLAHILGACPHGELLRNTRHHTVRSIIATALRNKGYSVYEEVHGISSEGNNRKIDIIAFKPPSLEGYIIDPTVRIESHEHQPEDLFIIYWVILRRCINISVMQKEVNIEYPPVTERILHTFITANVAPKKTNFKYFDHNHNTFQILLTVKRNGSMNQTIPFYKDKYSLSHIDVIGLMVGARGTIPSFFANKCKNLGLTHSIVKEIAISTLKGSVQILRNHLYGSDNGNFKLS
ncbi:hypothetical protein ANN_16826 [Periplaneta americana]|uniref:Reverse transcriptase n=1 Tax=Periplaneta americana TaxID=6978 RepID=A0ABQ8SR69_PERAM|nr:hypothetical protein ANN_16826 [Periplaneta americana]